ncbi:hypothetical protein WL19_15880 [Burkholderia ubonensis]|nr:hypothetical protein WL19_15880 [Burkholderia ubonensis]
MSFGEEAFMRAVLEEAGPVKARRRVPFNHMEGRAVSGLVKKGFVVRLDGEVEITDVGAAWLATVRT